MSRINTNIQSLIAQRVLGTNNFGLGQSLERLSTGLRINRGKDDPAGLIASENLRSEKASLGAAISNAERADQVANIAEGGLQEISSLLIDLQGLVTAAANDDGISTQEKQANQLQIDSILQTIDRISGATSFQGKKLLNGNLDYTATDVDGGVADFRVNGAKLAYGSELEVQAVITTSAQQAGLFLSLGGPLNLNGGTNSAFTIEVTGSLGSRELSFASGTSIDNMVAAINTFSAVTGVTATASGTTGIRLESQQYGSNAFVSTRIVNEADIQGTGLGVFQLTSNNFNTANSGSRVQFDSTAASNGVRDVGQDIVATINGIAATADGRTARINTDFLDVQVTFDATTAQQRGDLSVFKISGGGADFQLAPNVDIAGKVALGIADVSTRKLGNSDLGYLSDLASGKSFNVVSGDLSNAQKVVSEAIDSISAIRGRLGAFQKNTVGATIRNLSISLENTTAAESVIRDTNFAAETAALTRNQILVSASTNILALANSQPQSALQLLG
jgi:flagellin